MLIIFFLDLNFDDDQENVIMQIFQESWRRNIVSIMIVYKSTKYKSLHWFTFNGYKNETVNKTGLYDFSKNLSNLSKNLFKFKMKSCLWSDIPTSALIEQPDGTLKPGSVEGKAFYLMSELLNISNDIVEPTKNLSAFDTLIFYDRHNLCEVFFTGSARPGYLINSANIYPIFTDYWCVLMPKSEPVSGLRKMFMPFDNRIWVCLFFTLCLCIIFWKSINCLKFSMNAERKLLSLHIFGLFLNMGNHAKHQLLTTKTRIFLFSVSLFGIFVSYAYQSLLFGFMVIPKYYDDVHTLIEMGNSDFRIAMETNVLKVWKDFGATKDYPEEFNKALIGIDSSEFYHKIATNNKKFGYVLARSAINYDTKKKKGASVFYEARECLVPIARAYSVSCSFPLSQQIEKLMQRLIEMGFYKHWQSYVGLEKFSKEEEEQIKMIEKPDLTIQPLSLQNIRGVLQVWIAAILCCLFVFLAEIFWSYYKNICLNCVGNALNFLNLNIFFNERHF